MEEVDCVQARIEEHVDTIATHLSDVPCTSREAVRERVAAINELRGDYFQLRDRVSQGPDGPFDARTRVGKQARVPWFALEGAVLRMGSQFEYWQHVQNWIGSHLDHHPTPLYPEPFWDTSVRDTLEDSTDYLFKLIHSFVNPGARESQQEDEGGFADVALPLSYFMQHLVAAYRMTLAQRLGRPARFLDVGCGAGLTVLAATKFFAPAEGFDIVRAYVSEAERLMRLSNQTVGHVFEADGLNFENYADYDVIYFYCPLRYAALQHELEDRIMSQARPGTILIAPDIGFDNTRCGCAHVVGRLFLAHGSQEDAARLRAKSEHMGPCVAPPPPQVATPWAPILEVLARNGFHGAPKF